MKILRPILNRRATTGLTIIELLIAAVIAAIVAGAGFQFYAKMHQAAMAQDSISEIQHRGRNTIREMRKTLRLAGFNLTGHPAYEIKTDTLAIYFSQTQAVDTVLYFLDEFSSTEYDAVPGLPDGTRLCRLWKQTNSQAPQLFVDFVNSLHVVPVDAHTLAISMRVQAERADDKYTPNSGFRIYADAERVTMRNVK